MAVYTKRGDKGQTSLYDPLNAQNIRISKSSTRINAIGSIDELNSFLGIICTKSDKKLKVKIENIQGKLFRIGSILAGAKLRFSVSYVKPFEKEIDTLEGTLPVLKNFILPGGSEIGSLLHYARTLVRRAERALVSLNETEEVRPEILIFINRLSDYLFMLARKANFDSSLPEKIWKTK